MKTQSSITTCEIKMKKNPMNQSPLNHGDIIHQIEHDLANLIIDQNPDYIICKSSSVIHHLNDNTLTFQVCLLLAQDENGGFALDDSNEIKTLLKNAFEKSDYFLSSIDSMAFRGIEEEKEAEIER